MLLKDCDSQSINNFTETVQCEENYLEQAEGTLTANKNQINYWMTIQPAQS